MGVWMSLDETIGWKHAGNEMTCETDDKTKGETYSKTFNETCKK
jgi:hypothetical protein